MNCNIKLIEELKELNETDIQIFNQIRNDKNIMSMMIINKFSKESLEKTKQWILYKMNKAIYFFGIYLKNELIGFLNVDNQKFGDGVIAGVEIGIALKSEHWGKGLAKKAIRDLIVFLKQTNFKFIVARVLSSNNSSLRLFTSSGFFESARFKKIGLNKEDDLIFYIKYI